MITTSVGGKWGAAQRRGAQKVSGWDETTPLGQQKSAVWGRANPSSNQDTLHWDETQKIDTARSVVHEQATANDANDADLLWSKPPVADTTRELAWDKSIAPRDHQRHLKFLVITPIKDKQSWLLFRRTAEHKKRLDPQLELLASLYQPGTPLRFDFGSRPYIPDMSPSIFFDFRYVPPDVGTVPSDMRPASSNWGEASRINRLTELPWGKATPTNSTLTRVHYLTYVGSIVEIPDPPEQPDILEAYMIGNLVTVKDVATDTPLMVSNISMSYNADSFCWALTMDVLGRPSMNLIRPDAGVKEVEITVNGHVWVFLIEKYRRNFKFANETYSVTGSSRTILLAAPYAPTASGVNALDINAHQVMDAQVATTGFTISWSHANGGDVPDWTIPAGALSYNNQTPMQLIAKVASAIGAIIRPGMADDVITIIPRYLAPVWEWSPGVVHKILPAALITNLGGDWTPKPAWDSCYVSGTSYGCSVLAVRSGAAGTNPAPDVFDDILTDQTANAYRAMVEVSKGGDQELVTLQLPLFPASEPSAPGLILPGHLCNVQEADVSWVGVCLDTAINCSGSGASVVTQTVKLERHTSEI